MMRRYIFTITLLLMLLPLVGVAQKLPERSLVRQGNRQFAKEHYAESIDKYQRALLHDSTAFEARYNLANALLRRAMADTLAYQNPQSAEAKMAAGYIAQAEGLLQKASADSLRCEMDRSEAYYNMGNTQFVQQKLQDALRSYRRALTLNPDDMEAKYNYALTKKLLEQQQNQDQNQNNDQNQDQNQDQNNNQNQNQNQNQNGGQNDNQNNQNDNQNQDQNQNQNQNQNNEGDNQNDNSGGGDDEQNQGEDQAPPRSGMSDKQREQVLNAIQAQEDKTQEKLDEEKAKGIIIKGRKNW